MNGHSDLTDRLFELQDPVYREFHAKLMPNVEKDRIIGIRIPVLRKFAKEFAKTEASREFMRDLPHYYYEENNLHAYLIEQIKDFDSVIYELDVFLPYVDNWATCDTLSPKVFKKHKSELESKAFEWMKSEYVYVVRFGIGILMKYFWEDEFDPAQFDRVLEIKSEEYYINMMIAWYFATALAKQYDSAVKILEENKLDIWVHNKTIQKAVESNRISDEMKKRLRRMKR